MGVKMAPLKNRIFQKVDERRTETFLKISIPNRLSA